MNNIPTKKERDGRRWLIPLVVIVLIAIAGAIAATVLIDHSPASGPEEIVLESNDTSLPADDRAATAPANAVPAVTINAPPIGTAIGMTAPDFTLEDLDGRSVSLSDFRGQVVLLNFWASWCLPCRISMPGLKELHNRYKDQGLVTVGVSLDRTGEAAADYLAEHGYGHIIALWESLSAAQEVSRAYGIAGIPHTFLIDREGIIRFSGHPTRISGAIIEPLL